MKKSEIIRQIEKTIKQLSGDPKEADTVKALRRQLDSMRNCIHGTEKNCIKCGGKKIIECNNPEVKQKTVSPGFCRKCKYFESLTVGSEK